MSNQSATLPQETSCIEDEFERATGMDEPVIDEVILGFALTDDEDCKDDGVDQVRQWMVSNKGEIDYLEKLIEPHAREIARRRAVDCLAKEYLKRNLSKDKKYGNKFSTTVIDSPPSVVIDDKEMIPQEFMRTSTSVTPNKAAIKNELIEKKDVPGVHLETGRTILLK